MSWLPLVVVELAGLCFNAQTDKVSAKWVFLLDEFHSWNSERQSMPRRALSGGFGAHGAVSTVGRLLSDLAVQCQRA